MEPLESSKKCLETYEELSEWRKKAQEIKKLNDQPLILLGEISNLSGLVSTALKDIHTIGKKICSETVDIKYQLESDNYVHVGKDSVQPLIELKNTASDVFAIIREDSKDNKVFIEEIDFSPVYQKLQKLRKFVDKSKLFVKQLILAAEAIEHLENESEKNLMHQSASSMTGSDPSTSQFSLFDNSETMVTSSPMSNSKA